MRNFSFVKKLRNERHAHYMREFLDGMPQGLYDNKLPYLTNYVTKEIENLNNCRKNHNREKWNDKVNELRNVMAALGHLLVKEAELGRSGGEIEKHSYFTRVANVTNNHDYVEAVRSFLGQWSGVTSQGAEALVEDAQEICEEAENLLVFMEMEDSMIANIPKQEDLRTPTDEMVEAIIKKAEVEKYELSPSIEAEADRLETIDSFLNFTKGWLKRITVSVKNSGTTPEPEPEVEPEPLTLVQVRKVTYANDTDEEQAAKAQFMADADFEEIVEDTPPTEPVIDGLYEVYP